MSQMPNGQKVRPLPETAKIIQVILKEQLPEQQYEPNVLKMLLNLMHRFVVEILQDAQKFAKNADKSELDLDDIRLAYCMSNNELRALPVRRKLIHIAEECNKEPLPMVRSQCGLRLPPRRRCLLGVNFKDNISKSPKKKLVPMVPVEKPKREIVAMKPANIANLFKFVYVTEDAMATAKQLQVPQK